MTGLRRTLAVVFGAGALYVGFELYRAGLNERPPPPSAAEVVFHNGIVHGQRITTRSWTADYERIVSNADQTVLELDTVRHGVIFKKGKPYLRVRATHLSVNTISRDFTASGPLHVETVATNPSRSFDTNAGMWNDAAQRLTLPNPVTIDSGARAPLHVGSLSLEVKSGKVELRDVSGSVRFK